MAVFLVVAITPLIVSTSVAQPSTSDVEYHNVSLPEGDREITVRVDNENCVTLNRPSLSLTNEYEVIKCEQGVYYEEWQTLVDQHVSINANGG